MVPRHEITKRKGKNGMTKIKKPSSIEYIWMPAGVCLVYGALGIITDNSIMKWVFLILQVIQCGILWVSGCQYTKKMKEFRKTMWLNLIEEMSILVENEPPGIKKYYERMIRRDFPDMGDEIEEIFNRNQGEKDNAIPVPLDHRQK